MLPVATPQIPARSPARSRVTTLSVVDPPGPRATIVDTTRKYTRAEALPALPPHTPGITACAPRQAHHGVDLSDRGAAELAPGHGLEVPPCGHRLAFDGLQLLRLGLRGLPGFLDRRRQIDLVGLDDALRLGPRHLDKHLA
mmetsp:Transcript_15367/g.39607  ORF Transcript_15367/g.39607 Transcript_15367/m.39607 type:complete len:141 (-) Transcript_15367:198-620(-)